MWGTVQPRTRPTPRPHDGQDASGADVTTMRPMSRLRAALGRVPLPLALLLAVAAVSGASWGLVTAPLQGPDEPDHVAYAARLAERADIPQVSTGGQTYGDDENYALGFLGLGPLVQNRSARPPWSSLDEERFRRVEAALPDGAPGRGAGPNPLGKNPPLSYVADAIGWRLTPGGHFFGRLWMMRLVSTLELMGAVLFAWLLAGEVFGRRRLAQVITAGFMAALPMAGFMGGIVTTDMLLTTIWSAFAWAAVRSVRLGITPARAGALAALTVASVLTHGRGLALVPALAIVLVVAWLQQRPAWRPTLRIAGVTGLWAAGGLLVLKLVTTQGGGGGTLYGGEATLGQQTSAYSLRQFLSFVWQFYLPKLQAMVPRPGAPIGYRQIFVEQYFTGVFANFDVYFRPWVYDTVQVIVALLLIIGWTVAVARFAVVRAHWPVILVLGGIVVSLVGFLHLASYRAVLGGPNPLIVGRYLLPMTAIVGVGLAALIHAARPRWRPALAGVLLGALAFLSIAGMALNVERFYV